MTHQQAKKGARVIFYRQYRLKLSNCIRLKNWQRSYEVQYHNSIVNFPSSYNFYLHFYVKYRQTEVSSFVFSAKTGLFPGRGSPALTLSELVDGMGPSEMNRMFSVFPI